MSAGDGADRGDDLVLAACDLCPCEPQHAVPVGGEDRVTLTVARSGGSSGAVSVGYSTSDGSASSGSDYQPAAGTLSWADGDTSNKTIAVTILTDNALEPNETFTVTLSNASGATLGSPAAATVTIVDSNNTPPVVAVAASATPNPVAATTTHETALLSHQTHTGCLIAVCGRLMTVDSLL